MTRRTDSEEEMTKNEWQAAARAYPNTRHRTIATTAITAPSAAAMAIIRRRVRLSLAGGGILVRRGGGGGAASGDGFLSGPCAIACP